MMHRSISLRCKLKSGGSRCSVEGIRTRGFHDFSKNYPGDQAYDGWYDRPPEEVRSKKQGTTAIVFGWANSDPRHVRKYTQMYASQLGIGAHGCILPMDALYAFDQARQSSLARQCLQVLS